MKLAKAMPASSRARSNCAGSTTFDASGPRAANGFLMNASARSPATRRPGIRLISRRTVLTSGEIRMWVMPSPSGISYLSGMLPNRSNISSHRAGCPLKPGSTSTTFPARASALRSAMSRRSGVRTTVLARKSDKSAPAETAFARMLAHARRLESGSPPSFSCFFLKLNIASVISQAARERSEVLPPTRSTAPSTTASPFGTEPSGAFQPAKYIENALSASDPELARTGRQGPRPGSPRRGKDSA